MDGCWSLVSMSHIIHKFVNVYPLIAYSCEVAIHIIMSWILGSGPRWYGKWHSHNIQEQGNDYSLVDIIAFLFEVFKYLFKKLFLRQIFLRAFIFLMQNSWKPWICFSYGYKQSYALYWLHHDTLHTKGFYCNIYWKEKETHILNFLTSDFYWEQYFS